MELNSLPDYNSASYWVPSFLSHSCHYYLPIRIGQHFPLLLIVLKMSSKPTRNMRWMANLHRTCFLYFYRLPWRTYPDYEVGTISEYMTKVAPIPTDGIACPLFSLLITSLLTLDIYSPILVYRLGSILIITIGSQDSNAILHPSTGISMTYQIRSPWYGFLF